MNALFITHTPQLPSPHHKLHIRNPQLRNTTYLKYMRIVVSVRVCRNFGGPSPLGRNPSAWACAPLSRAPPPPAFRPAPATGADLGRVRALRPRHEWERPPPQGPLFPPTIRCAQLEGTKQNNSGLYVTVFV